MNKIKIATLFMSSALLLSGCSDFLTPENRSSVTDEQQFGTKTGFESLVNDAYSKMRDIYANSDYNVWFNAGTDMYATARNKIEDSYQLYETLNPENSYNASLYKTCYAGIRAANAVRAYAAKATAVNYAVLPYGNAA